MTDQQIHERYISLLETNIGIILKISKAYSNIQQDREDLISTYVRSKHGLVAQIRKIDRDIEEISKLEMDLEF